MAKRGRPPKLKAQATKREIPPTLNTQTAKRGRPRKNHEPNKTGGHHVKHGRPPKQRNKIESRIPPLSLCPPPVIHPFRDQGTSIEWGERLDALPESDSETSSFVSKVKMNSKPYVLKVFKFFDPLTTKWFWGDQLGEEYPIEKAIAYTDPFYAECRAYGRIQEAVDKGILDESVAVKCHGYIFLDADARRWLEGQGLDLGTKSPNEELLPITGGAGKLRALVKDFEIAGPGFDKQTTLQIRECLRRVWLLNRVGIYNRDVKADNFRNGRLVDFDTSYTLPHDIYKTLPPFEAEAIKQGDVAMFEDILEDAGVKMRFLATKNYNFRPRSNKYNYEGSPGVDRFGTESLDGDTFLRN